MTSLLLLSDDDEITCFCLKTLQGFFADIRTEPELFCPSLILADFALLNRFGLDYVSFLVGKYPLSPVLIISRCLQLCFAVKVVRDGARDFIPFPCASAYLVRKIKKHMIVCEESPSVAGFEQLLGVSPQMRELKVKLADAAAHDHPLLLLGETGTGKSFMAKLVHAASERHARVFFELNVTALNETLAASELFGSVQGAFTGASNRQGFFEKANRGTLFLDEIGDLPVSVQSKLLHVVENGVFYRIGSTKVCKSDVRLILATNVDLLKSIREKSFRPDLYYRIAVFLVEIPPLRERREDVRLLADFFASQNGKRISSNCLQKLLDYNWPGNVRELANCLLRASYACAGGVIDAAHIEFAGRRRLR